MMSLQAAIPLPSDAQSWSRIAAEVHAWRGACIQAFAQAEAAVTETLLFLSAVGDRGKAVGLRHLTGQRLDDLALALAPEGPFAAEGGVAHGALAAFRIHEGLRVHLAHDVERIAVERNGDWVVIFRRLAIRRRVAERSTIAFEQSDAANLLFELQRTTQRLDATLGNMRRSIELARSP